MQVEEQLPEQQQQHLTHESVDIQHPQQPSPERLQRRERERIRKEEEKRVRDFHRRQRKFQRQYQKQQIPHHQQQQQKHQYKGSTINSDSDSDDYPCTEPVNLKDEKQREKEAAEYEKLEEEDKKKRKIEKSNKPNRRW